MFIPANELNKFGDVWKQLSEFYIVQIEIKNVIGIYTCSDKMGNNKV